MKVKELREKSDVELTRMLSELRERLRDLRFKRAAQQLADVRDIREAKRAIARILTLTRQKATSKK